MSKVSLVFSIMLILYAGLVSAVSFVPESLIYSQDPNTFIERNLTVKNILEYPVELNVAFNFTPSDVEDMAMMCFFTNDTDGGLLQVWGWEAIANNYTVKLSEGEEAIFRFFSVVFPDASPNIYNCGVNFSYFQRDTALPSIITSSSGGGGHHYVSEENDYDEPVKFCSPEYSCGTWSGCQTNNYNRRICRDVSGCTSLPRVEKRQCSNITEDKEVEDLLDKEEPDFRVEEEKDEDEFVKQNFLYRHRKAITIIMASILLGLLLYYGLRKEKPKSEDENEEEDLG